MRFIADVHLHSRFSRATSRQLNPENLYKWSALKGVNVVGTGDFTHPEWIGELKDRLEPAEEGLYRLKPVHQAAVDEDLPERCRGTVRFVLSSEISVIYKKNDKTRKVHHVVLMSGFEAVERLNARLGDIGNLKSDGRPILGLDSRDLVEICVEAADDPPRRPAGFHGPCILVSPPDIHRRLSPNPRRIAGGQQKRESSAACAGDDGGRSGKLHAGFVDGIAWQAAAAPDERA